MLKVYHLRKTRPEYYICGTTKDQFTTDIFLYPDGTLCSYPNIDIRKILFNTKAEAETVLSEYLNSLSPEEFAKYTAERILQ